MPISCLFSGNFFYLNKQDLVKRDPEKIFRCKTLKRDQSLGHPEQLLLVFATLEFESPLTRSWEFCASGHFDLTSSSPLALISFVFSKQSTFSSIFGFSTYVNLLPDLSKGTNMDRQRQEIVEQRKDSKDERHWRRIKLDTRKIKTRRVFNSFSVERKDKRKKLKCNKGRI